MCYIIFSVLLCDAPVKSVQLVIKQGSGKSHFEG